MLKDLKKNMQLTLLNSDDLLHLSCLLETDTNEERKAVLQNKLFSILTAKTVGLEFEVNLHGINLPGFAASGDESFLAVKKIVVEDEIKCYIDEHRYISVRYGERLGDSVSSLVIPLQIKISEKETKFIPFTVYEEPDTDCSFFELSERDLANNSITVTT